MSLKRPVSLRNQKIIPKRIAGIAKTLFAIIILVTVIGTAAVSYVFFSPNHAMGSSSSNNSDSSNFLASPADLLPISNTNSSENYNQTAIVCNSGNWSAIYSQYESPLNLPQNSTLGKQYVNDPQFMSFLSQYLNVNDPYVNSSVRELLSGNESSLIQQQLQSENIQC